jgi:hypothetical protein
VFSTDEECDGRNCQSVDLDLECAVAVKVHDAGHGGASQAVVARHLDVRLQPGVGMLTIAQYD